ncbi:MAG TPA: DUF4070 domain-containing protein, partial [Polyangia bacterium]
DCVFVGIETPSREALRETHKGQNLAVDLNEAIDTLIRSGLDVNAGFIMGFDADDRAALDRQREWVLRSPIPQAMIGILTALPGTQLERRLTREGRLIERASGETFGRANFKTKVPESTLLETYRATLEQIYSPEEYFARCLRALRLRPRMHTHFSLPWTYALRCVVSSIWRQGVTGQYRKPYWKFLGQTLRHTPRRLARAIALAVAGEHMIRYTKEAVLPRLSEAIEEVRQEVAEAAQKASKAHRALRPQPVVTPVQDRAQVAV